MPYDVFFLYGRKYCDHRESCSFRCKSIYPNNEALISFWVFQAFIITLPIFIHTGNFSFSILILLPFVEMKTPRTSRYERDDSSRSRNEYRYDRCETPRSRQRSTYDEIDRYRGRESYRESPRDYHGEKRGRYSVDRRTPGMLKIVEDYNDNNLFISLQMCLFSNLYFPKA